MSIVTQGVDVHLQLLIQSHHPVNLVICCPIPVRNCLREEQVFMHKCSCIYITEFHTVLTPGPRAACGEVIFSSYWVTFHEVTLCDVIG